SAVTPTFAIGAVSGALDIIGIQALFITRNTVGATMQIDDVRVGSTWASVAPIVWKDVDGDWGDAGNWHTGAAPDAAGKVPSFLDVGAAPRTVDLGAVNRTAGGVIFNSPSAYTIASTGGGVLNLDTPDAAIRIN